MKKYAFILKVVFKISVLWF